MMMVGVGSLSVICGDRLCVVVLAVPARVVPVVRACRSIIAVVVFLDGVVLNHMAEKRLSFHTHGI